MIIFAFVAIIYSYFIDTPKDIFSLIFKGGITILLIVYGYSFICNKNLPSLSGFGMKTNNKNKQN